jgi:DNA mismatch repair protein MutS
MNMKHLSVYYDRELDCLVYDRKLKEGSGNRMYGLEVCKSLYMPEDFLEKAYKIREKYFPDTKGVLSETTSRYNAGKIKGMCEICTENLGEDVHHLREQVEANNDGFIEGFHKNHPANLINICKKCHLLEHKQEKEQESKQETKKKRKTINGYKILK